VRKKEERVITLEKKGPARGNLNCGKKRKKTFFKNREARPPRPGGRGIQLRKRRFSKGNPAKKEKKASAAGGMERSTLKRRGKDGGKGPSGEFYQKGSHKRALRKGKLFPKGKQPLFM